MGVETRRQRWSMGGVNIATRAQVLSANREIESRDIKKYKNRKKKKKKKKKVYTDPTAVQA
jgi:hypothetical protein